MTSGGKATRAANSAAKKGPEGRATVWVACVVAESRSYVAYSLGRVNFGPARKAGVESIEATSVTSVTSAAASAASGAFAASAASAKAWASASVDAEAAVVEVAPS